MIIVNVTRHLLDWNCSNSTEDRTIDLDVQLDWCRSFKESEFSSISEIAIICQRLLDESCFRCKSYLCFYNSSRSGRSTCLSYERCTTSCSHCSNGGACVRGDLHNHNDFQCRCPKCTLCDLCEFSISLEYLIERTGWGVWYFLVPSVFLLLGWILNGLCFGTLLLRQFCRSGTSLYLLSNSISSFTFFIFT